MASTKKRKSPSSNKNTTKKVSQNTRKRATKSQSAQDRALFHEISLIALFAVMLLLFCCNFGLVGPLGDVISSWMFGLFGIMAYAFPVLVFVAAAFYLANVGNPHVVRKLISGSVLFFMIGVFADLIEKTSEGMVVYSILDLYHKCSIFRMGGGIISGSISYFLKQYIETTGTILVCILISIVCIILLTEKSILTGMRKGGAMMRERSMEESARRREELEQRKEQNRLRREEQEALRLQREEEKRLRTENKETERILRMEKKVSGVSIDTTIVRPEDIKQEDIHEIVYTDAEPWEEPYVPEPVMEPTPVPQVKTSYRPMRQEYIPEVNEQEIRIHKEGVTENTRTRAVASPAKAVQESSAQVDNAGAVSQMPEKRVPKKYMFPPLSRLQKGASAGGDTTRELKETALRLQNTLNTFGVNVTITDISQGPSVTRYELQPEQGVKVSRIVSLADDIKLNLAATDIRIEAPIPGKAAIGIEVPNKENTTVALRDLLESREFREYQSNIAFAVGKDIAGKVIVTDIAKMPHMLIAGATGSGKSVCINTLIMSILYKAHPDDVKLIMIDPKVVELSVYNGIPHLLVPVVTDPKKASAALHWGVTEMEDRYRKFADMNVRDLKGYNKKVEAMLEANQQDVPDKMPQIVIIVDELADLMMVAPGEVEESICRLAQLARAAGIHLIIATQRPSVDVITGLIKANMPSRVAFSVSSGVDSRTILDMNGAEKLLGKGDMLFYPQGYSKPARIQGAFVSDKEVSDVVDFLKNQSIGNVYAEEIEAKIKNIGSGLGGGSSDSAENELDELFEKAGRFIIEKDKASIGSLQRVLKIGFNRAARIMDQLCEYGVVGEEEGTKPRKILMSPEQFEQLIEEIL